MGDYPQWAQVGPWMISDEDHSINVTIPWVAASSWHEAGTVAAVTARIAILGFKRKVEANNAQSRVKVLQTAKYDPPLVRFHCEGCGHTWDAWINEDGSLQDARDVACADQTCTRFGQAAELVPE